MPVVRRAQQDLGAVRRAGGDSNDVGLVHLAVPVSGHHHLRHLPARRVRVEARHLGVDEQRHIRATEQRPHGDRLGVGFGVHEARVPVARPTTNAGAVGPVFLGEQDAARRMERVIAALLQFVVQLLDARHV